MRDAKASAAVQEVHKIKSRHVAAVDPHSGLSASSSVLDLQVGHARTRNGERCKLDAVPRIRTLVYVDGLNIDYLKKGLNEGFEFVNPNEKDRCGCGESFRV